MLMVTSLELNAILSTALQEIRVYETAARRSRETDRPNNQAICLPITCFLVIAKRNWLQLAFSCKSDKFH